MLGRRSASLRSRAVLCVALLLVGIAPLTASAAPDDSSRRAAASAALAEDGATPSSPQSAKDEFGIPVFPTVDQGTGNPNPFAGGFGSTTAQASASKVTVRMPAFDILGYIDFCVATPGVFNSCCPDGLDAPGCKKFYPDSSTDSGPNVFWLSSAGPTWVRSPKGSAKQYGTFPSVTVQALAFGSIPVTARIDITQSVGRDGYYRPITIDYALGSRWDPGDTVGGLTAPPKPDPQFNTYSFYTASSFTGSVDIRVSDVTVDRVPIDVGPNCRTQRPASLSLGAPAGFADTRLDATDVRGRPGEFALTPGSTLQGNLAIPAFTGCKDGSGSLDPLITSFVSSPRNAVESTVSRTIDNCTGVCPPYPTPTAPPATAQSAAASQNATTPERAIAPTAARIAKVLVTMSASARASLITQFPAPLARAVKAALR